MTAVRGLPLPEEKIRHADVLSRRDRSFASLEGVEVREHAHS
jgi:hypothetical protein